MKPFRFVHAADLHLDAPFVGLGSDFPDLDQNIHDATFQAFDRLIELCLSKEADFLLIAGDIYNQEYSSLRAQLKFRDGLARLSKHGVSSFVVHGNHDPINTLSAAIQWPDNVHIFASLEPEYKYVFRGYEKLALVCGISHARPRETRNLARELPRIREDIFQIGLLHCNLGSDTGHEPYAPCTLEDLFNINMDYWALGHVHTRTIKSKDPYIVYPGNIQGLNIREQEEKGCYLIDVDEQGHITPEFHPLDVVRWSVVQVSISDIQTLDELEGRIWAEIEEIKEKNPQHGIFCRVVVSGRGQLHKYMQRENAAEELLLRLQESEDNQSVGIKDIRIDTLPEVDLKERRRSKDLMGEVLRIGQQLRGSENLKPQLDHVLRDLFGNRRMKNVMQGLSEDELREVLHQAELLCLDLLENSGDSDSDDSN